MNATAPAANAKPAEQRSHEPSMEEILASIRRIIADDQGLPVASRPSAPVEVARVAEAPPAPAPAVVPEPRESVTRAPRFSTDSIAEFEAELAAVSKRRISVAPKVEPIAAPPVEAAPPETPSEAAFDDEAAEVAEASVVATLSDESEDAASDTQTTESFDDSYEADVEAPYAATAEPAPVNAAVEDDSLLSPSADASVASSFQALSTSVFLQNTGMIEQTIRDLIKPMLKQWLDDNLPVMVERLVRAEIERVARGGRG